MTEIVAFLLGVATPPLVLVAARLVRGWGEIK